MPRGRPFPKTKEREIVTARYILDKYPVNNRWIENAIVRGDLRPFKAGNSRLNFYYRDEVDDLFSREEAS